MNRKLIDAKKNRISANIPIKGRTPIPKRITSTGLKNAQPQIHAAHAASVVSSTVGIAGPLGLSSGSMGNTIGLSINQAGAGAPNLSGTWFLDRENSDSTNDYLEAMGLPLIARQAADKLDLTVVIHQTAGDFNITRKTRIFTETKQLKFGQEVVIKGTPIRVTGSPDAVKTVSQLPGCHGVLTDTRTVTEDRKLMKVVLELSLPDREPVVINRLFKKISDSISPEVDEELLLRYMTPVQESKRKR